MHFTKGNAQHFYFKKSFVIFYRCQESKIQRQQTAFLIKLTQGLVRLKLRFWSKIVAWRYKKIGNILYEVLKSYMRQCIQNKYTTRFLLNFTFSSMYFGDHCKCKYSIRHCQSKKNFAETFHLEGSKNLDICRLIILSFSPVPLSNLTSIDF